MTYCYLSNGRFMITRDELRDIISKAEAGDAA